MRDYRFIALPPTTPSTAEATAITTFKIMSQRDFLTAITLHTSFLFLFSLLRISLRILIKPLLFNLFPSALSILCILRFLCVEIACVEARTLFDPLFRFYLSVTVQVRAEIPVSAHPAAGKQLFQLVDELPDCRFLCRCPRICRLSLTVQTAFVAYSDRVGILLIYAIITYCYTYKEKSP